MFSKKLVIKALLTCAFLTQIQASDNFTLDNMLVEVIQKDPSIQERLHQYESIVQEVEMSKSGYLPTLDLSARSGKKISKTWDPSEKDHYDGSEISLKLVQNIFNGYGTEYATNRDIQRAKAAYYKYLEVAQDKMKNAAKAYIDLLKFYNTFKITEENIKIHEKIQQKISERFKKGYGTKSELERVKGRLSLAISNYVAAKSNFYDARIKFEKSLGRDITVSKLLKPEFKYQLPKNLNEAMKKALENNPSIIVSNYDINVAKEAIGYANKNNYPTIDLELEAVGYNNQNGSADSKEADYSAMLVLNYNLFNGNSDKAEKTKYKKLLNYEYAHKNRLLTEVKESLNLSWNSYTMLSEQIGFQKDYKDYTEVSKDAYFEEFQLGRRTLIDLLDIQDEINSIRMQIVNNEYNIMISKYRILDATGDLYTSFINDLNTSVKDRKYID